MNKIEEFPLNGFAIIDRIYTADEVETLLQQINKANTDKDRFRKSGDLFAIRQFLIELPSTLDIIFNDNLKRVLQKLLGDNYFVVKSIYFDKPQTSNWYVSYHQDLTISVDKKVSLKKALTFGRQNKVILQFSHHWASYRT